MRKAFIAGNWKMNILRNEAKELTERFVAGVNDSIANIDVVLCPPYTVLDLVERSIGRTGIMLGAQDVFWKDMGPFTGEVSPAMLLDVGCKWVIIGHSERRNTLSESDELVKKKLEFSLEEGLNVILCVGETLDERSEGKTIRAVSVQLERALLDLELDDPTRLVIAYEPVWAIGTGRNATPDQAQRVQATIREITGKMLGENVVERLRIVYGGSVTEGNIEELLVKQDIDGALVGGASLVADSLVKIVQIAGG